MDNLIRMPNRRSLRTAGLFAGIGGIERGLSLAGHQPLLLSESEPNAQFVLAKWFPSVPLLGDIRELRGVGRPDLICAGFPCQDLSQAGKTAGITGAQSGLINEVFRVLDTCRNLEWLLLENVPFMLNLAKGAAMKHIVAELDRRNFRWAYRIIDTRAFGLPHRRRRVLLLASQTNDPRPALLNEDAGEPNAPNRPRSFGFYWTEGNTGLGWAEDAVPTLKGGSSLGIPSPPAVWIRGKGVFCPDIRDAERLQGFDADWTLNTQQGARKGARWKLVGNAVSVPVAKWLGERLTVDDKYVKVSTETRIDGAVSWPAAAWGSRGRWRAVKRTAYPTQHPKQGLTDFLKFPLHPLSATATEGFLARARASRLRFKEGFIDGVAEHLELARSEARIKANES